MPRGRCCGDRGATGRSRAGRRPALGCVSGQRGWPGSSERANNELSALGHAEHQVTLERVIPFFGDPRVLLWAFLCETHRVALLANSIEA